MDEPQPIESKPQAAKAAEGAAEIAGRRAERVAAYEQEALTSLNISWHKSAWSTPG